MKDFPALYTYLPTYLCNFISAELILLDLKNLFAVYVYCYFQINSELEFLNVVPKCSVEAMINLSVNIDHFSCFT